MHRCLFALLVLLSAGVIPAPAADRPVNTYSIVARDPATGEMGVAVQSHWFSVGSVVTWAEPGVGAVATQSFVEVSYGPLGLELMQAGKTAEQALAALLAADPHPEVRQVAMVDRHGSVGERRDCRGDVALVHIGAAVSREDLRRLCIDVGASQRGRVGAPRAMEVDRHRGACRLEQLDPSRRPLRHRFVLPLDPVAWSSRPRSSTDAINVGPGFAAASWRF